MKLSQRQQSASIDGHKPTKKRRWMLGAVAVVAGSLALAGCSAAPVAGSSDSLVTTIQSRGALLVGVAPDKPNMYQTSSGKWTGVFIDFADQWAKTLGVKVQYVSTTFGTMVAGLQSDKFDVGMDLNQLPARAVSVNFSNGIVTEIGAFEFNSKQHSWATYSQLNQPGTKVCVPQGASEDIGLTANNPKVQTVRLPTDTQCYAALISGRVDAVFANWTGAAQFANENASMKMLFPPTAFVNEPEAIAINKKYSYGDIQALNIAIDSFTQSGGVANAYKADGVVSPAPYSIQPVPAYAAAAMASEFGSN